MTKAKEKPTFSSSEAREFFYKLRDPKTTISEIAQILVDNPSFIKEKDGRGRTILHYAATVNDLDRVKYLCGERVYIEKTILGIPTNTSFCNPNVKFSDLYAKDNDGLLPSDFAVSRGNESVVSFFDLQVRINSIVQETNLIKTLSTIEEDIDYTETKPLSATKASGTTNGRNLKFGEEKVVIK